MARFTTIKCWARPNTWTRGKLFAESLPLGSALKTQDDVNLFMRSCMNEAKGMLVKFKQVTRG